MIYSFFSDIHGQLDALRKLASRSEFQMADKKICLGDVFSGDGYGGAQDIFHEVKLLADLILLGNHEAYIAGLCDEMVFSETSRNKRLATRDEYDTRFVEELSKLPRTFEGINVQATHASFNKSDEWRHVRYIEDLASQEQFLTKKLNVIGHGHIPFIAWKQNDLWYYQRLVYDAPIILDVDTKYLINVGSILGSRELRERERTFVTYDDGKDELRFFNLEAT